MNKLLSIRKNVKKHKPEFRYHDSHKVKGVNTSWRRPRGHQAKIKLGVRGKMKGVTVGYKSPVAVRGLHGSGLRIITVTNTGHLLGFNKETDGVMISGTVGTKRLLEILLVCSEKGYRVLNFKDINAEIKRIETGIAIKKKAKETSAKKKEEAKTSAKKEAKKKEEPTAEKKDELAEKAAEDERKEKEEKEKMKVLTSKDTARR